MSRIVTGLEQNGLAQRRPSKTDARALLIVATGKGRRLMRRGQSARVESLALELRKLSKQDLDCLQQAVKILTALEETAH